MPLIFIFLENKKKDTYKRMLQLLKMRVSIIIPQIIFNPEFFMIDFESAMIKSIEDEFPNSTIKGCLFHYCKSIWRYVQGNFNSLFRTNERVKRLVKNVFALSLTPIEKIDEAFEIIFNNFS